MSSLKADFNELMERIKQGREFGHASFEPIFYLVFPPNQILNVKRETPAWMHRLRNEGWEVETFSIAEHIADIIEKAPLRKIWLAADQKAPLAWEKTNASLANAISNGALPMPCCTGLWSPAPATEIFRNWAFSRAKPKS